MFSDKKMIVRMYAKLKPIWISIFFTINQHSFARKFAIINLHARENRKCQTMNNYNGMYM